MSNPVRTLRTAPGFSALVILTLAIGLGSNVALFTLVNGVLLRPLDFHAPEELFAIHSLDQRTHVPNESVSLIDFEDWRRGVRSATGMTALCYWLFNLTGEGEPERLQGARTSGNFFDVFGVPPALGRYFTGQEDHAGRGDLVVISHGLWQRRFGGRPDVLGKSITLNGAACTIIGVTPLRFRYPDEQVELWAPIANELEGLPRASRFFFAVARVPKAKTQQARSELEAVAGNLRQSYPDSNNDVGVSMIPLRQAVAGDSRPALLLLFGAIAIVLLITSANVINLALARATNRTSEIAIRLALGATRWDIVWLLAGEGMVLVAVGGALAVAVAKAAVAGIVAFAPKDIPRIDFVTLDGFALTYAALVSLVTGVLIVVGPMWNVSVGALSPQLAESGRTTTAGSGLLRLRAALVAGEVALTTILIIGGGLLTRSLWNVVQTAPGFSSGNRLALRVFPVDSRYDRLAGYRTFVGEVLEKSKALPGVVEVAAASHIPLGESGSSVVRMLPEGGRMPVAQAPSVDYRVVSSGYFHLMSIPMLQGRGFVLQDDEHAPSVIIVNASLAKELWPNEDPIGKQVRWLDQDSDTGLHTVIGVVGDVRQFSLEKPDHPAAYATYAQRKFPWLRWMNFIVRSERNAANLTAPLRDVIHSLDPNLPVFEVSTLEHRLQLSLAPRRFLLVLMATLAWLALVLGLVGIYGVVSYLTLQRRAEFAIRIALGATNREVAWLVLSRGVLLAGSGLIAGVAASVVLSRYVQHLLFGVAANDPIVMAMAGALVLGVSTLACLVPAFRATRVDPVRLLRA